MILLEINNRVIEETLRAKFTGWDCTLCSILLVEVYKWSILANVQIYKAYAQLVFSFTQREVWVGGYNSGRCVCFLYIFLLSAATDERNHKKITTEKPIITKGWTYHLLGLSPWKPSLSSIYGRGIVILCQLQLRVRCEHCGLLTFWRTDKFWVHWTRLSLPDLTFWTLIWMKHFANLLGSITNRCSGKEPALLPRTHGWTHGLGIVNFDQ